MFLDMPGFIEELDVALDDFGPGQIAPAPELWGGRAGNSRDSRLVAGVLDGDSPEFFRGKWQVASLAITLALQQQAAFSKAGLIGLLDAAADAFGQARFVGFAECGDGDFL